MTRTPNISRNCEYRDHEQEKWENAQKEKRIGRYVGPLQNSANNKGV